MPRAKIQIVIYRGVLPTELLAMWRSAFIRHFTTLWRSVMLSQLKAATPVESGRLKASIYAQTKNARFSIKVRKGGFYWFMVDNLPERYLAVYNRMFPKIASMALQRANREVPLG